MAVLSEEIHEHETTFDIWERFLFITTMHFSRMRTVRCSSRLLGGGAGVCLPGGGGVYLEGVSAQGGLPARGGGLPRGCLPIGCLPGGSLPRWVSACQGVVSTQWGCLPRESACQGGLPRRVSAWEVSAQGCVCLLGGVCLPAGGCILPLCGQTDTCENITFPQLLLRTVKIL